MDNICVEFFALEPTPLSAWRMAILMGANTRTYKFALGAALLELAREGREAVSLDELAVPYAELMLIHGMEFPQAPNVDDLGEADYLRILTEESEGYAETGIVSERLVDATVESVPGMVMQKFHNLRGTDGVPFRFYEIEGRGANRVVRFSPALKEVAANPGRDVVDQELNARWSLVESARNCQNKKLDAGSGELGTPGPGTPPARKTAPMRSTRPIPRCLVPSVNSPTWQRWPDTARRAAACLALGSGRWPPEKPYVHET